MSAQYPGDSNEFDSQRKRPILSKLSGRCPSAKSICQHGKEVYAGRIAGAAAYVSMASSSASAIPPGAQGPSSGLEPVTRWRQRAVYGNVPIAGAPTQRFPGYACDIDRSGSTWLMSLPPQCSAAIWLFLSSLFRVCFSYQNYQHRNFRAEGRCLDFTAEHDGNCRQCRHYHSIIGITIRHHHPTTL